MQTFTLVSYLVGGMVCLYLGAEILVYFASKLALSLGMTPLVVGLTVVAFSTSTPELASSLMALFEGDHTNIAIGNVIGSNIANIGLILAVILLIRPLPVQKNIKTFETPLTIAITLVVTIFMLRGHISRFTGIILVIGICLYVAKHLYDMRSVKQQESRIKNSIPKDIFYFFLMLVGVAVLAYGGSLLVNGSVALATIFGVSDRVIGLTIVAVGTSLPEFAASLIALIRQMPDIAIGNIIGSNIFNLLFILGVVAIVQPISFSSKFLTQDMPILVGFSVLLWALMFKREKLGRLSGLLLLLCYIGYLFWIA